MNDIPPGWIDNPSRWHKRAPLCALALAGMAVSLYLALDQFGVIAHVWEPFFGDGSRKVLHSSFSESLPVPDAALGVLGYAADAAAGVIGGHDRWRTKPWIVLLYGLIAAAIVATGTTLAILQGAVYHHYCTLCLTSAALSILIAGPALEETLAALQQVARVHLAGASWWDALRGREPAERRPEPAAHRKAG
jgi:hypothetical protein